MNFLDLFNAVARVARPVHVEHHPVTDATVPVDTYGLDSLDMLMTCIYLCEIYGIPEEVGKTMPNETVKIIEEFIVAHKTQEPESIDSAVRSIQ